MSWWNPWGEIARLERELNEALATNRKFVESDNRLRDQQNEMAVSCGILRDLNWSLAVENKRLGSLMERAVFRDPETGRLLPKGRQH